MHLIRFGLLLLFFTAANTAAAEEGAAADVELNPASCRPIGDSWVVLVTLT
jgi:hypothetical protein